MDQKLCIYTCSLYHPEALNILSALNSTDITIKSYPFNCKNSLLQKETFNSIATETRNGFSDTIVIGGSCCASQKSIFENQRGLTFYKLDYCAELILNKESIMHFIRERYYIISSGWLADYKQHIESWGFDQETAKMFFRESAEKILLLETGIPGEYLPGIEAFSNYTGLPYEVLPVGLSHCRLLIESLVDKWRLEADRKQMSVSIAEISKRTADNSLVFEQMLRLVDLTDETEIVSQIFNLLNILFAPKNIFYIPIINGKNGAAVSYHSDSPAESGNQNNTITIEVNHQGRTTGIFRVSEIAFEEYIVKYQPMKEVISKMSGLVIANARKYKTIKDNEEQLKINQNELTILNETKDKFFSIIAHDLRGPIGVFKGYSELLAEDYQSMTQDHIKEIAGLMVESSTNLFGLLENLLEWSQLQRGMIKFHPETFLLLSDIIACIGFILDHVNKKSLIINYDIPDDLTVSADKHMFNAVIRNLVSNAIKFTPGGGKILISAAEIPEKHVEIRIKDTGIGMPAGLISKLFKMNENTSRPGTDGEASTGLGLILCKEFVEKNGGKIWAESEEKKGSTFCFSLPSNV